MFAVSTIQEELQDQYFTPFLEYEVQKSQLKEDLLDFLDSHIYDHRQTNVIVLCDVASIKELLYQVIVELTMGNLIGN